MRLALLVPDGVGVRNFVLGGFLDEAVRRGPVDAFHAVPDSMLATYRAGAPPEVAWHAAPSPDPRRSVYAVASALGYAHMYWVRTRAMERRLAEPARAPTAGRWAMVRTARLVGRAAASPRGIRTLSRVYQTLATESRATAHYRRRFEEQRPDVVFSSNQRPPEVAPAVLAARRVGIPTATFIFSWDNLTSKPRIVAPFEHFLVWSELMRSELLRFYPDVDPARVHVVGTPQFDPYADRSLLWSREDFCAQVGADPARPLVCYSGGDAGTCPEDPQHVRILLQLVRDGLIREPAQVVLRPSPVDDGRRYESVRAQFPELRYAPPAWVQPDRGGWARVMPLPEDIALLANITHHCDVNVNHASTMTLDFVAHDRPVVNVAFDVASPPPFGRPTWDVYYQYDHYRPVWELGAARMARSPAQLAEHVNAYLACPALDRAARRRLLALQVLGPLGGASARVVAALARIADGRSS